MRIPVLAIVATALLHTAQSDILTQTPTLTCSYNSPTTFLMQLCVNHNEDDVQLFVAVVPGTNVIDDTCEINMVVGVDGTSCVSSLINTTDIASSENRCGATTMTGGWQFEFWSRFNVYFTVYNQSVNYHVKCMTGDLTPGIVQTQTDVTLTQIITDVIADSPAPRLFFVDEASNLEIPLGSPIIIGTLVRLRAQLMMTTFTDGQTLYGLYLRNCQASTGFFVGSTPPPTATTNILTDDKGCVNPDVVFPPLGGEFKQTLIETVPHKFETTTALAWPMRILFGPSGSTIIIYIQCEVVYCGGPAGQDSRCNDSCANVARRKRDADLENDPYADYPKTASTYAYVTKPNVVDISPMGTNDEMPVVEDLTVKKIALIGVSTIAAILLVVGVTLAVCVYLAYRREDDKEKEEEREEKKLQKY